MLNIEFKYILLLFGIVSFSICSKGDEVTNFTITFDEFWNTHRFGPSTKIPVLQEGAISDAKIEDLDIEEIGLTNIEPGAFKNLPNLRYLKIHHNIDLTEIKSGVFNAVTSLTTLALNANYISKIAPDAFDNLPNLQEIELGSNNIHEINPEWFANTPALKTLDLSFNKIEEIPANAFKIFQNKSNLIIDLSYNSLKHIDDDAFKGLNNISHLSLKANKLTTINWNVFTGVNIEILGLTGNRIRCINEEDFDKAFVASETTLMVNPLEVGCVTKIKKWAKNHQNKRIIL